MPATPQFSNLVHAVYRSMEIIGIENTISNVTAGLKKENLPQHENYLKVLEHVAASFQISSDEILRGIGRKNDRHLAIGFCAYYLHNVYKCKMEVVMVMLEKDISICYKYSKRIEDLDPTCLNDEKYIELKKVLDTVLIPQ